MSALVPVFSYGSNSVAQLRARVENPDLQAFPAKLLDWERIFCVRTATWGGAAASLIPQKGSITFGSAVYLTEEELSRLDNFEGGYHKEYIDVVILKDDCWISQSSLAYIANTLYWTVPPSEAYLTAIHVNLWEQFGTTMPQCANTIDVYGVFSKQGNANVTNCRNTEDICHSNGHSDMCSNDASGAVLTSITAARSSDILLEHISSWTYPGSEALSLPALCVEVNAQRKAKWVMPRAVAGVVGELRGMGIMSSAQLASRLSRGWRLGEDGTSCDSTAHSGKLMYLDQEALDIFSLLLKI
jgi:hypothetical protein